MKWGLRLEPNRCRKLTVPIDADSGAVGFHFDVGPDCRFQAQNAERLLLFLQQAGRMVGVISHVPELKERIDVRQDVQGSRSGSTAGFVLP